ncbi:hypothetical protein GCM10023311_11160 [Flaviramulus aquimarinus]|uniref:Transporter n=1 Tax=Flaviramulus aquimarinus TaxID=1170456 RepID=A0ABP9EWA1_9FLAO
MKHFFLFFLVVIIFNSESYSQSKIDKAEDSLKESKKSKSRSYKSRYNNSGSNDDSKNNFLTEVIGEFFVKAFLYSAYSVAIESPFEMKHRGSHAVLTKHPYKSGNTGNYTYEWNADSEVFTTSISNRLIFETNRLYGNHLNINTRFLQRVGLEIDYLQLWEVNPNFGNNALAIYTALVKYHRVRTERFNAWWGLGASYIDGNVDELGFTYGLGVELFFVKPFSLESNFNQTLINSNSINKFNALLNYHRKQYKFSGGYEHLKIGDIGFSTFSLGVGVVF